MNDAIATKKTVGQYEVHETRREWLLEKLAKMNRKAEKLGLAPVAIEWAGVREVPLTKYNPDTRKQEPTGEVERFYGCTVTGIAPVLEGWSFVATLAHGEEAGTVIRTVPGFAGQIPTQYRTASRFVCDHCQKIRNRKDTYLLQNEAGAFKQVGANCLADFLGGLDPHKAAEIAGWSFGLDELLDSAHESSGYGDRDRRVHLLTFLAVVAAVIRVNSRWTSRGAAKAYNEKVPEGGKGISATADDACGYMFATGESRKYYTQYSPMEQDGVTAEAALAWVKETFHAKDADTRSDFEHNLVIVTSGESVQHRSLGLAAAAVGMHRRHLGLEEERKARALVGAASKHFGTVGERLVFNAKLLWEPKAIETQYGTTYLHKFLTAEGNLVTWFGSSRLYTEDGEELKAGAEAPVVALIGTIKNHDTFKGEQQTVVNRVALATQKQIDKATGADKVKKAQAKAAKAVETRFQQLSDSDW